MGIAVCMIAKNEEEMIRGALESVKDFGEELIVVDTGSQDETVAIAKAYGAKVIESPWRKDFSYHRNESIALAKEDWVFFLDCDERLQLEGTEETKERLRLEQLYKGYNVTLINEVQGRAMAGFLALRLFKNKEGFKFKGTIHEQVIGSICDTYGEERIGTLPLVLHHLGYDPHIQQKRHKAQRNLELLQAIPCKDSYVYNMIGNEYLQLGQLAEAEAYYRISYEMLENMQEGHGLQLMLNYTSTLINEGKYPLARTLIERVLREPYVFKDMYFLLYWAAMKEGKYDEALRALDTYSLYTSQGGVLVIALKYFEQVYNLSELRLQLLHQLGRRGK